MGSVPVSTSEPVASAEAVCASIPGLAVLKQKGGAQAVQLSAFQVSLQQILDQLCTLAKEAGTEAPKAAPKPAPVATEPKSADKKPEDSKPKATKSKAVPAGKTDTTSNKCKNGQRRLINAQPPKAVKLASPPPTARAGDNAAGFNGPRE